MKLEGIHHITAITGDAAGNVEFYTGVLGLRMVKRTVNQDDPTVYHLFYGDEHGSPGMDLTFFEYPGAAPRRAGRGDGAPHRLAGRLARRRWTSGRSAWRARASSAERRRRQPAVRRPRGPRARAGRQRRAPTSRCARDSPEIPAEHALQGFEGVRAYSRDPSRSERLLGEALGFERRGEGAGRCAASSAAASTPTTPRRRRSPLPGRRHACTTSPSPRRMEEHEAWRERVAEAGAHPTPGDRPLLLQLGVLPRAERRAVRDRHDRPRLRGRRGRRRTSASGCRCRRAFEPLREQLEEHAHAAALPAGWRAPPHAVLAVLARRRRRGAASGASGARAARPSRRRRSARARSRR